ncbi:MAG: hypothetical protein PHR82_01550 [Endomicrobiaceae bacterium]|nr:hypothetical protein [Endomicrobiaceae bacterium]
MNSSDNKIMGVDVGIVGIADEGINELFVDSPVQIMKFINEKYEEIKNNEKYSHIIDTRVLRVLTTFEIAKELLTIKGNEAGILDTNTKKMKELIRIVDDALQVPE